MAITLGSNFIQSDTNRIDISRTTIAARANAGTLDLQSNDGIGNNVGIYKLKSSLDYPYLRHGCGRTVITGVNVANDYRIVPQLNDNAIAVNLFVGASYTPFGGTVPTKYLYGQLVGFFTWDGSGVATQRLVSVNDARGPATDFQMTTVVTAGSTTASRIRFQITNNELYVRFVSAGNGGASDTSTFEYRIRALDTLEAWAHYDTFQGNSGNTPFPGDIITSTTGNGQGVIF